MPSGSLPHPVPTSSQCPGDSGSRCCPALLQAHGAPEGAVWTASGREPAGEQRRGGGAQQSLQGNRSPFRLLRTAVGVGLGGDLGPCSHRRLGASVQLSLGWGRLSPTEFQYYGFGLLMVQFNFCELMAPVPAALPLVLPTGALGTQDSAFTWLSWMDAHMHTHVPPHTRAHTCMFGLRLAAYTADLLSGPELPLPSSVWLSYWPYLLPSSHKHPRGTCASSGPSQCKARTSMTPQSLQTFQLCLGCP